MILRIFLLAISLFVASSAKSRCPEHYAPKYFEESSDELSSVIEEYFLDRNISFLPVKREIERLGLKKVSKKHFQIPNSTKSLKELYFPVVEGVWNYTIEGQGITTTHLLIKEISKLSEIEAINVYNGLLGAYWNDYKTTAYEMTLSPEDSRIRYENSYFELNIKIYGLRNDATKLPYTYTDIIFRDYTHKVKQYMQCKESQ